MNRRSLLFAALGLTVGAGTALAAGHAYRQAHDDDHRRRRPGHHDDDDNDDGHDGERRRATTGRGPAAADPKAATAPVPNNRLFQNGARPKADVQ